MPTPQVVEGYLSEFDYYNPLFIQSSITGEYDEVITTANAISPDGNALGAFEFVVPGAPELFRDLNNSFLKLRLKVTDAANANLGANDPVAPVNLLLHSLFANVTVTLCGKEITEKDSLYPYRAYLETLLTYSQEVLKTRAITEGWAKDDGPLMNNITLAVQANQPDPNSGFVERRRTILQSRAFTLIGRPHVDLFHQNLDIPPDCKMVIRFTPSPVVFAFIGANAHAGIKVVVLEAALHVRTKRACPELVLAQKQMLEHENIRIPHNRVTVTRYGIAQGFTGTSTTLNFPAKLPKRLFIGFVLNAACTGAIGENPFNFQHFGLTDLTVNLNGNQIPADGMKMNYATGDYHRAYINTLAALGLDNDNRGICLTPHDFANGFNIHGFKISPGPIDGTVFCAANSGGSIVVKATFGAGLAAAVDMIVFAETPAVLEIDKLSGVTLV
jgi:hypothetical protein